MYLSNYMREYLGVVNNVTGEEPPVMSKAYKIVVTDKDIKENNLSEDKAIVFAYHKLEKILKETNEFGDCMQIIPVENITIVL